MTWIERTVTKYISPKIKVPVDQRCLNQGPQAKVGPQEGAEIGKNTLLKHIFIQFSFYVLLLFFNLVIEKIKKYFNII